MMYAISLPSSKITLNAMGTNDVRYFFVIVSVRANMEVAVLVHLA
jgi:hypothetical protein